jgi:hypothetical protein
MESTADLTVEGCAWKDRTVLNGRIFLFEGRSLAMRRCNFSNCGHWESSGGCILARSFRGDVVFESVEFFHVTGKSGSSCLENTAAHKVDLLTCIFAEGYYHHQGFLAAQYETTGPSQQLILNIADCSFKGCRVEDGYGSISSHQHSLSISNTKFENCTDGHDGSTNGCFINQFSLISSTFSTSIVNWILNRLQAHQ